MSRMIRSAGITWMPGRKLLKNGLKGMEMNKIECPYGGCSANGYACSSMGMLCDCCKEDRADRRNSRVERALADIGSTLETVDSKLLQLGFWGGENE